MTSGELEPHASPGPAMSLSLGAFMPAVMYLLTWRMVSCDDVGNWDGEGRFKMWFNHGGAIEFGQAMLHAGQLGELSTVTHYTLTTFLKNLEMSRNFAVVREVSGNWPFVGKLS